MRRLAFSVLVLAFAATACGEDDGSSAAEYRGQLTRTCVANDRALLKTLPALAARRDLDRDEVARIGERLGNDYLARLRRLDPPNDLRSAHEQLIAHAEQPSTTDARVNAKRAVADFRALGASRCGRLARRYLQATAGG